MAVNIQFSQSYYWLTSWVMANVIQLATQDFCDRFVGCAMDPGRRWLWLPVAVWPILLNKEGPGIEMPGPFAD